MTIFSSDNVTGACPEVMDAIVAANEGIVESYGNDKWSTNLRKKLSEIFETDVVVFPVVSGTAANALALSVLSPAFGKIYCNELSHINTDECGAPEFFSGGAKLVTMSSEDGKINAKDLSQNIRGTGIVHLAQPAAVSITQACETGTIYQLEEIESIAETAHEHGLKVHMDGARFANAIVSEGTISFEPMFIVRSVVWAIFAFTFAFSTTFAFAWSFRPAISRIVSIFAAYPTSVAILPVSSRTFSFSVAVRRISSWTFTCSFSS